jgi:hypothetical protein
MKTWIVTATTSISLALAACSPNGGTIYRKDSFGPYNVLSLDARQRLVIQGYKVDKHGVERPVICSEPSPDAIAAQAANLAAGVNATLPNSVQGNAQLAAGYSEAVASIAMRTQSIQVLRDGYYRLCEAYLNDVIGKQDYVNVVKFIDEFIATVVAIEALGGTVVAAPISVSVDGRATVKKDGEAETENGETIKNDIDVTTNAAPKENVAAIEAILKRYYIRKAEYQQKHSVFAKQPDL